MKKSILFIDLFIIILMFLGIGTALYFDDVSFVKKIIFISMDSFIMILAILDLIFQFIKFQIKRIENKLDIIYGKTIDL